MGLPLTDAQFKQLADKLFLLQPLADTHLPKPTNSKGSGDLDPKFNALTADPRFSELGIGVVDFTKDLFSPRVWLQNGNDAWRAGSTAKISMMLAAVQLRDDVRWVQQLKFLSKPEEYDALFALPRLWSMAPDPTTRAAALEIAGKDHAPRISTLFDFSKPGEVDFFGPDPNAPDATHIVERLALQTGKPANEAHLTWGLATDFDFSERLWLAGARSDNVAASSCISELGVAYLKAVQKAYRLFDERNGMHLLLAGPYTAKVDSTVAVSNDTKATYRQLRDVEMHRVKDALLNTATNRYEDQSSWQPGSAAALCAYLIALAQDRLVALGHGFQAGEKACTTLRANLSHGVAGMTQSHIVNGVKRVANVDVQFTKIGLLRKEDLEPAPLNCEFAYLETSEKADATKKLKYGVVVSGIRSKPNPDGSPGPSAVALTQAIGEFVHQALAAP